MPAGRDESRPAFIVDTFLTNPGIALYRRADCYPQFSSHLKRQRQKVSQ